jgi:quinohemoprotein ethanol dehydrogenase
MLRTYWLVVCVLASIAGGLWFVPALAQRPATIVDDAMLRAARPAGEWLTHGGDYAETRFSPLTGITSGNVGRLGLAWSVEVGSLGGRLEATPIISNGVLYAPATWNVVHAIDLRTQDTLWTWDPGVPRGVAEGGPRVCCGAVSRGVAIYRDRIYAATLDGRLAALDAATGREVWMVQTTPPGEDYSITGAPRVVKGKVVIGNGGGDFGVRGYITAYDAETGDQAWRFYFTPGDPSEGFEHPELAMAAETWSGEWWRIGAGGGGGTAWDAFAYDPEADLLYVGTGNGGPWNRDTRSPGGGDNLFLASILALRPDTGRMVWHYQTTPGESWDFTAVQQMTLADLTIDGRVRQVLMQAPKNGFFYVLDRLTGAFISAAPIAAVNWASGIDASGRPIENPGARYEEAPAEIFPGPRGAHNWHPMSWHPSTGLMYIPGQENSFLFRSDPSSQLGVVFRGGGAPLAPATPVVLPMIGPRAPQGQPGFLVAWDPVRQEERWRVHFSTRENSGTLATAGNLVFHGSASGLFAAHDALTGEVLWEMPIHASIGSPVTYELDGRQYIAVLAGPTTNNPPGRLFVFAIDGNASVPGQGPS